MAASTTPAPRVMLGPLTTIFSPPPHCTSLFHPQTFDRIDANPPGVSSSSIAVQAVTCNASFQVPSVIATTDPLVSPFGPLAYDPLCWPLVSGTSYNGTGIYSPGLMCPEGFTIACSAIGSAAVPLPSIANVKNFSFKDSILSSEGAVGCCPRCVQSLNRQACHLQCLIQSSGYECFMLLHSGYSHQTCLSTAIEGSLSTYGCLQSGQSGPVIEITSTIAIPLAETVTSVSTDIQTHREFGSIPQPNGSNGWSSLLTQSASTTETSTYTYSNIYTTNSPAMSLFAPLIQLNWGPLDVQAISRELFPTSALSKADPTQNRSGIPTSAKVAIGVVAPVLALIIVLAGVILLLRRRRQIQREGRREKGFEKPELDASNLESETQKISLPTELSAMEGPQELGPGQLHELTVPNVHHELAVPHVVHEIGDPEIETSI